MRGVRDEEESGRRGSYGRETMRGVRDDEESGRRGSYERERQWQKRAEGEAGGNINAYSDHRTRMGEDRNMRIRTDIWELGKK